MLVWSLFNVNDISHTGTAGQHAGWVGISKVVMHTPQEGMEVGDVCTNSEGLQTYIGRNLGLPQTIPTYEELDIPLPICNDILNVKQG